MAKRKSWIYKGGTDNRYLEVGKSYEFNPKKNPDGTVSAKIKGSDNKHKMNIGYRDEAAFERSWGEA